MIPSVVNGASPHDTRPGTALGVVAILLWGSTVAFGRSLTAQLGPIHAAAAVYALWVEAGSGSCGYLPEVRGDAGEVRGVVCAPPRSRSISTKFTRPWM